ncbi:penicillin-binding protein 2 [Solemya velum gill symbiont]|uniref:penicillin-binding protein 2 n=1 Tax=Solemya velum gill symbiont TaxID=2340 RepID=UPI0009981398|nr:penicillin-binding protein 2 [Solemya velum gill symbiont]OOZ15739.1 penicillin-binding protein 2 [Solemya velum gill symbiont]OOZ18456.1 penicillin-binding protein 2 [Solemya velum gill symbiont]OOZ20897.1 penicillin-binding protein 2 [Solemya velum gill symbiont]OOZ23736.1 penicillin-binding protein 2 [Solemya velum gill symbiont]OOZ25281.1 penicillin-binding protein 2 [Solemya velum gill symbiont]
MAGPERINKSGLALFRSRAIMATLLVVGAMTIIISRMMWLQVDNYVHYATLSADNRIKLLPLPPPRGNIYDRAGRVLAKNISTVDLLIDPEQVQDMQATIDQINTILPLSKEEVDRFKRQKRRTRRFQKIPIKHNLSDAEMARFAVERHRFRGVELGVTQRRNYPYSELTAHVVGYIGRINERELESIDQNDYAGTTHIGKTGLEKFYESHLHGEVGVKKVEIDAAGQIIRTLEVTPPIPGKDLHLYFDVELQRTATDALGEHNGSVVSIETATGGILTLVSKPSFNPNSFVNGIGFSEYNELRDARSRPLFNRAVNGSYPPGSTVKPFIGLAGLEQGVVSINHRISCAGSYRIKGRGRKFRDWKRSGHGVVSIDKAIYRSCDVYFYDLAHSMGIRKFHDYLDKFHFGRRTGIDMPRETTAILPSPEWKKGRHGENWYPGDTVNVGIGQGYFQVSPLQLAYATTILASDGRRIAPRLVARIGDTPTLEKVDSNSPIEKVDEHNWEAVLEGMVHVVETVGGTARRIRNDDYRIGGKTGTAQVFSLSEDEEYDEKGLRKELLDHALFIAFAPVETPEISISVIAEHGGHGGSTSVPVAKAVMDQWFLESGGSE